MTSTRLNTGEFDAQKAEAQTEETWLTAAEVREDEESAGAVVVVFCWEGGGDGGAHETASGGVSGIVEEADVGIDGVVVVEEGAVDCEHGGEVIGDGCGGDGIEDLQGEDRGWVYGTAITITKAAGSSGAGLLADGEAVCW